MSTNRGISPSLSITLWSHTEKRKKKPRGAFKAFSSWQEEQRWIKEEGKKKKRWESKEKNRPFYKEGRGGGKGRQGVGGSSSDRANLQLSQIISAREVRGGEMSKYLNKFHRSLLRVGRCSERGIVGANGVERGWEGLGIKKVGLGAVAEGACMRNSLHGPGEEHELNGNQRFGDRSDILAHFKQFPPLA